MPLKLSTAAPNFEAQFQDFLDAKRGEHHNVDEAARALIEDVRARGDQALIELTARFDGHNLTPETLHLDADEAETIALQCPEETVSALKLAAERITDFHRRQEFPTLDYTDETGTRLGARWTPLDSVGVYVPGGLAAYPSSVLMNTIPAKVAGVERIVMTAPTPNGVLNPSVIAAARIAGVSEIYRLGGAQAVAALAYGTETILPVDKIVGPGNAFVASAKKQVFGQVGIDMIAGPSEILVVADDKNDPQWVAADLLSQAEHGGGAQSILITDKNDFAEAVIAAADAILSRTQRRQIAEADWKAYGTVIVVENLMTQAPPLVDRIAPEHLELAVTESEELFSKIRHAGAVFLGRHTHEAIGDYVAGPNHVLPTSHSARFSSGLNVMDFMKRTTFVSCTQESLNRIGPSAVALAEAEGLVTHGLSVSLRLDAPSR